MEPQLRVYGEQDATLERDTHIWDEWTQVKRRRYLIQDRLRHLPKNPRLDIVTAPELELEPIPGPRGRLVQLVFSILLQPPLPLPLEADIVRERLEALEPQAANLLEDVGLTRLDDLLYWIEQRYPNTITTAIDSFGSPYRPTSIVAVKTDELSVLYMRLFQEWPAILGEPSISALPHDVEELLAVRSVRERQAEAFEADAVALLTKPSVGDLKAIEALKSKDGPAVREFCPHNIRDNCPYGKACTKLHFLVLTNSNTDKNSGDCPYLDTCRNIDRCRYLHYDLEPGSLPANLPQLRSATSPPPPDAEWISCDIRKLDFNIIGKFGVVVADPPWDIHMELPYGTMTDEEMLKLPVTRMQDTGYLFLWVTGRAMELARECMVAWGYERVEELIWVKTNQVQRMLRAGRTGHWLNHSKEHCLVGVKGSVPQVRAGIDCDVLVAPLRETSRKPEELYAIIERLTPGMRRIELFGRPHNLRNGWLTLGNQLDGVRLRDPAMTQRVIESLREEGTN